MRHVLFFGESVVSQEESVVSQEESGAVMVDPILST